LAAVIVVAAAEAVAVAVTFFNKTLTTAKQHLAITYLKK